MADPIPAATLGPNLLSNSPPVVIPIQLATAPIDGIQMPSTLRKLASSVRLRWYDIMYGEILPKWEKTMFYNYHKIYVHRIVYFSAVKFGSCIVV